MDLTGRVGDAVTFLLEISLRLPKLNQNLKELDPGQQIWESKGSLVFEQETVT